MDLATLKSVFEPLSKVGKDEFTFEVGGQTVTVRPLLPHEEIAVQRYAVQVIEEEADAGKVPKDGEDTKAHMDRATALDYFDRFRIEVVSYSIVQINDADLREVPFVETGEITPSGVAVKVPRYQAVREIIRAGWSRTMITSSFSQYGELIEKLAKDADSIASRSTEDLESEIERVETRLSALKEEKGRRAEGDPNVTNKQIKELVGLGVTEAKTLSNQFLEADKRGKQAAAKEKDDEAARLGSAGQAQRRADDHASRFEEVRSSFEDGEDPEVLAVEQHRIMEARRKATQVLQSNQAEASDLEARQQEERQRLDAGTGSPTRIPDVGGVEAYRLPTEELSPRGRKVVDKGSAKEIDPKSEGTLNPKFERR